MSVFFFVLYTFQVDDHGVSKVCVSCKRQYSKMNSFFSSLNSQNGGHICMDLIDMVWSYGMVEHL